MKPHLYFYSDCPSFAGCENMLPSFFDDERLRGKYRITFGYRHSFIYESGFKERVKGDVVSVPLKMADLPSVTGRIPIMPLRLVAKAVSHVLLLKYIFVLWNTAVLYREFARSRIDILHINNGGYPGAYSCMSAVFAARLGGIRNIVYVVNNVAFPYASYKRWLDYPLDRMVAHAVSIFVTGSAFAAERLKEVLRLGHAKAVNIHNGIKTCAVTEAREEVLRRVGIDDKRLLFAVVAVLEERKGHVYLLKALESLKREGFRLPLFLLAGDGPERKKLEGYADAAGLSDDIKFLGSERRVFNILNAADAVVLPSTSNEDFPFAVLEAISMGKPVIASAICGIPEQIEDMKSGILIRPKDVQGMASAIKRLSLDKALRDNLGMNAAMRFKERFTARSAVGKYIDLYGALLNAGPEAVREA